MASPALTTGTGGGHDFRLATVAAGTWCGAWSAAHLPIEVVLPMMIGSIATGWWCHRRRAWTVILAAIAMGFAVGATVTLTQVLVADAVRQLPPVDTDRLVDIELTTEGDPRSLRGRTEPTYVVPVRIHRISTTGTTWNMTTTGALFAVEPAPPAPSGGDTHTWADLLPGQRLTVTGQIAAVADRPGDLSAITIWTRERALDRQAPTWWQQAAGSLREGLRTACDGLPPGAAGLLPGLVVGDVSNTPQEITEDFRATGMSHLVAVSGSNVAIVVGGVLLVVGAAGMGPRGRTVLGCLTIVGFAILARPEPSVLRASVMAAVGLIAIGFGRRGAAVPAVSAAVTILILFDPRLASDLGFALSVTATLGLVLLANKWSRAWRDRGWPEWLAAAIAVPLAAQLAVTPLLAGWEGRISIIAVAANAMAAPAVPVATILGLLSCLLSVCWPDAAQLLAWMASWPTRWLIVVADHGAAMPMGSVPWPTGWYATVALALLLLVAVRLARHPWGRVAIVVLLVLSLVATTTPVRTIFAGWPPNRWVLVACDVGQGDALVLSTGEPGTAVVVDAGMDARSVDVCLRDLGITRVPLMVLSHFHADHVGGIAGVLRDREVGRVVAPHPPTAMGGEYAVTEALQAIAVDPSGMGTVYAVGALTVTVLSEGDRFQGTRSDPNNDSVVVLAEHDGVRMLLPGDIEEPGQRLLMRSGLDFTADVLKVPHHGSRYVEPGFFAAVSPAAAVVSVGSDNDYGHPHPRVLSELAALGVAIARTDEDGTVAFIAGDDGLQLARR